MSDDTTDLLNNLKNMVNSGNVPENIIGMLKNFNTSTSTNYPGDQQISKNKYANTSNSSENPENTSNIDFEMILRMKSIIDSMNSKDDPRANLLYSLKPYLRESRKKQLDQYVNLLNMTKIADIMNNNNNNKESNNAN